MSYAAPSTHQSNYSSYQFPPRLLIFRFCTHHFFPLFCQIAQGTLTIPCCLAKSRFQAMSNVSLISEAVPQSLLCITPFAN